jgi:hypothetical protein
VCLSPVSDRSNPIITVTPRGIDWADVGIAAVEGGVSAAIPGSGLLVGGISSVAKTGIDVKGSGETGVIGINKDWQAVKKDGVANALGFGFGALAGSHGGIGETLGEVFVDVAVPTLMGVLGIATDVIVDEIWPANSSYDPGDPLLSNPNAYEVATGQSPPTATPNYYVQADAFHSRKNAQKRADELRKRGYEVRVVREKGGAGSKAGLYYKVRIKAASRTEATEIRGSVGGGSFIVTD